MSVLRAIAVFLCGFFSLRSCRAQLVFPGACPDVAVMRDFDVNRVSSNLGVFFFSIIIDNAGLLFLNKMKKMQINEKLINQTHGRYSLTLACALSIPTPFYSDGNICMYSDSCDMTGENDIRRRNDGLSSSPKHGGETPLISKLGTYVTKIS